MMPRFPCVRRAPRSCGSRAPGSCSVSAGRMLSWQSVASAGSLAWQLEQVPVHRTAIHQPAGMVSVQAAVSIGDGLALLRAHSFAEGRPLADVAAGVVAGVAKPCTAPWLPACAIIAKQIKEVPNSGTEVRETASAASAWRWALTGS
jgi:hypothetical protein